MSIQYRKRTYNLPVIQPQVSLKDIDFCIADLVKGRLEFLIYREDGCYSLMRAGYNADNFGKKGKKYAEPAKKDWLCEVIRTENGGLVAFVGEEVIKSEFEAFFMKYGVSVESKRGR